VRSMRTGCVCLLLLVLAAGGCDALTSTRHRIAAAQAALDAGELARAGIELRKAVASQPNNPAVRLALTRLSLETGDLAHAQQELDRAIKVGAKGAEVDGLQARIWLATRQPKHVVEAITSGRLSVGEPQRSIYLARAYNLLGQPQAAKEVLAPLLVGHAPSGDAGAVQAQSLLIEGQVDAALKEASAAAASDPTSVDAPLLESQLLAQRGQLPGAEQAVLTASQRISASTPIPERVTVLGTLTDYRLAQGKLAEAAKSQADLGKLLPGAPVTVLLGARLKLARGKTSEGIADLQRVVERMPNFVPARLLLGGAQLSQGNLNQAQVQFEQILQQAPDNLQARKLLARVRLQLNEPQEALQALNPALNGNATDPQLYRLLEATQVEMGDPASALATLERAVRANPSDRNLKLDLAQAYLGVGRGKDALALLGPADPGHDDLRRARLYVSATYAVGGAGAATEQVEKLLQAHPKDLGMLNLAASYFSVQSQMDRARALLQQALAINARDVATLGNLARVDLISGDVAGAEAAMRTALSAEPHNVRVRVALADILVRRGALAEAEQILTAEKDTKAPELQFALAQLELARGEQGKANEALDRVISLQPNRAELVNQAGTLLMQNGKYEAALARFQKATELEPKSARYVFNVGRAQLAASQENQARLSFQRAHELNSEWIEPVTALALLDVRAKKFDEALQRANDALAKHPGDPDALVLKGDVLASAGKIRDAAAAFADAQRRRPDASTALKLFQIRSAAAAPEPDEPLQQWLALQPNDYRIRDVLGTWYLGQHALQKAAEEFELVVRQVPGYVPGLNNLAWTYFEMNDPRAQSYAQRAHQLAPSSPVIADTLGWILVRERDLSRGLPLLEQATKGATDPEIQYHYAYALAQSGKRAEARDVLTRVLAGKRDFQSRHDAERLLADLKV
jgi:putative PEP-CTERM system TPR-repeat lipoprotein